MFAVLDTDHYVALSAGGRLSVRISERAAEQSADLFITVITAQEITQGWLAAINREAAGPPQVFAYRRFLHSLLGFSNPTVLPFDEEAARCFSLLQGKRLRVGTMDLKIAAICIAHDAPLLSRNLLDFERVPDLRVENWLG